MRFEKNTGEYREIPDGVSFTTLFFGPFPMLFRREVAHFMLIGILALITAGLSNIFFAFFINRIHHKKLLEDGYTQVTKGYSKILIVVEALTTAAVVGYVLGRLIPIYLVAAEATKMGIVL